MKQRLNYTGLRPPFTVHLAVMAMVCLWGGVFASQEALKQVAGHVVAGQWDAALSILNEVSGDTDPCTDQLKGLLQEHQALEAKRLQQRQTLFQEKCQLLDALEPESLNDPNLLKAMELFNAAWSNAAGPQREALLARPVFQILRQAAHEKFTAERQAGRWDVAWTQWMRWLAEVAPETYQQASEDLQQRRALANALRKNPCDETAIPYSEVKRETVMRIIEIVDARYAEPVPFNRLAEHGLQRVALLPEVCGNITLSLAVDADPDGFSEWAEHVGRLRSAEPPKSGAEIAALLDTLCAINQTTLKLPEGIILAQFTEAALAALDPYTEAVWPEGVSLFEKNLTGQFGGVGIRIKRDGDSLVIVSVIPDTPAAETSLAADDSIVAVDGQPAHEMSTDCAVKRISGPVGTAVSLTVRRAGLDKDEVVTVLRQKIVLPTVEGSQRADNGRNQGHWDYFLDAKDRIGYLQLNGFTDKTTEQARHVLEQLEQSGVKGLIIDVRGNGGGLLSEATAFANLFIDDGILLSSRGRGDTNTTWQAKSNAVKRDYPIVILIDEGSASASEIVAGVVAARKPGQTTLIGQRSYGKGTVQEVVDLGPGGGRLKLTTANYYLPDGQPVQNRYKLLAAGRTDWGIAPVIEMPIFAYEKTQIQKIQGERRKQLMAKEPQRELDVKAESLVQQMLMADAQLSVALIVIKTRILTGY